MALLLLFWVCAILAAVIPKSLATHNVIEGTELKMAFMIHRHGDRTPVKDIFSLVQRTLDMDKVLELVEPWGYGQLTNEGKLRGYRTGEFIKRRYNDQISRNYNHSEIYIRSTDSTRAKMTVLTAMSAVYPVFGKTWNSYIDWIPVPYTTFQPKYDYLLFSSSCPTYVAAFTQMLTGSAPSIEEKHADLLDELTQLTGVNFTKYPVLTYGLFDGYVSIDHLGYELEPEIKDLMPELQDAADKAMKILFGSDDYLSLVSGPLLTEFFTEAEKVISGESTQKIRIYSAHDVNVYGFEVVTGVADLQGVPKYGALYSLELRRVVETGEYVVLPVYLTTPEEPAIYLHLGGCDDFLCPYDTFFERTSSNAISEAEWREQCEWSEDMNIDISSVE